MRTRSVSNLRPADEVTRINQAQRFDGLGEHSVEASKTTSAMRLGGLFRRSCFYSRISPLVFASALVLCLIPDQVVQAQTTLAAHETLTAQSTTVAPSDARSWADKMFKDRSHDFRTVGRGTKCEFHFEFTNLYEQEVHVSSVRSSCGCTTPRVTKDTLKTHEKSAIVAKFNTDTFIGQKAATITVVIDRPAYAEVRLTVKGFIRTDITFDPPEVSFGEIGAGETSTSEITITRSGNPNWQITDVRSLCSNLQVHLNGPERLPNMVRYRMTVNILSSMPEGDVRERLTLISNDREFPTTEMSVTGRVRPTLSVSPATVGFGSVKVGNTVSKRLVVRGEEPFAIEKVVCPDKRFQFDLPKGSKKLHIMNVKLKGGALPAGKTNDRIGQEIRIVTDLADNKSVTCVMTGSVVADGG